jgi:hypothetical protein
VSSESPHIEELGIRFVRVETNGTVVVEYRSKSYAAEVGERFDAPGMCGLVSVIASDTDKQTATLGGKWCDKK